MRKLGNEFGATTGRPRRCGWFDALVVRYAARVNGLTDLAVTKLDVLDTLDRLGVCIGYEIDGELHEEFPGDLARSSAWCRGTSGSTAGSAPPPSARTLERSAAAARRYLDRIEALVEAPITT